MSTKSYLYFAYASNLLAKRIHFNNPNVKRAGIGKLKNYRLDFIKFSERWHGCMATIVPHEGFHVWGALWEVDREQLHTLDRQESVHNNTYIRNEMDVELINGIEQKCFVYQLYKPQLKFIDFPMFPEERRPSQIYLDIIIKGAEESNLPKKYQQLLNKIPHNGFNGDINLSLNLQTF